MSAAAENVLGALLLAPERLPDIADWLSADDFDRADHATIYRTIGELAAAGTPIDAVTVGEALEGSTPGAFGLCVDLAANTPSAANLVAYAEIVVEQSRLRTLARVGMEMADAAMRRGANSSTVAAHAEAALREIQPARASGPATAKAAMTALFARIQRVYEGVEELGLTYPWQSLSDQVRMVPGEVTLLAGRPSMGKSVLGFQIAVSSAMAGKRTLLFSLETTVTSVGQRMAACVGDIPMAWIRKPDDSGDWWPRLTLAIRDISKSPLLIDDTGGLSAAQIAARAQREVMRGGIDLIVVDHLHELRLNGKQGEVIERAEALRDLKRLAKRLNVPVMVLAQLNREAGDDKRPNLKNLRGSGGIEEVADVVLLLHRPDYYDQQDRPGLIEVEVAKSRDTERGVTVNLRNRYDVMRADEWDGPIPSRMDTKPATGWGKRSAA